MVSNIYEFEQIFNMNPYKVLGVNDEMSKDYIKKIYKEKSLLLHPDKSRQNTNLEFQILNYAYNVIKKDIESKNKNFEGLKLERKNEAHIESDIKDIIEIKENFNTKFADMRKDIRLPTDVGYEIKERTTKTTYDTNDIIKPEKILSGKKFNNEKFNAIFEHLKKNNKELTSNQIIKFVNFYDTSLSSAEIYSNNEKVVYGNDGSGPDGFTIKNGLDYKDAFNNIINPGKEIKKFNIDYERKSVKANMTPLTRSQIKQQLDSKNQNIQVTNSKSRAEIEADFLNNKLETLRLEKEYSKKMVNKYKPLISYR